MPLSIKERYSHHKDHEKASKKIKHEEEKKQPEAAKPKDLSVKKDYGQLYGEASKGIAKLIDKQSHMLSIK